MDATNATRRQETPMTNAEFAAATSPTVEEMTARKTIREKVTARAKLDAAARLISVSRDWADFLGAMKRGYIPTIRTDDNAAPTAELKAAARMLIAAARDAGCAVYAPLPGSDDEVLQRPGCATRKFFLFFSGEYDNRDEDRIYYDTAREAKRAVKDLPRALREIARVETAEA